MASTAGTDLGAARGPVTALALLAASWSALLVVWPAAAQAAAASGEGGWWVAAVYEATGRICHQQLARSFTVGGLPFPVCGRCLSLYLSGTVGLVAVAAAAWAQPRMLASPRRPLWRGRMTANATWVAAAAAPSAAVLAWEWLVADPGNVVRAVASVPLGLMAAWLIGRELASRRSSARGAGTLLRV